MKSAAQAMSFEATPLTKPSVKSIKKASNSDLDRRSGWAIMGYLVLRYRHGLVATYATFVTVWIFVPSFYAMAWELVKSLFAGH